MSGTNNKDQIIRAKFEIDSQPLIAEDILESPESPDEVALTPSPQPSKKDADGNDDEDDDQSNPAKKRRQTDDNTNNSNCCSECFNPTTVKHNCGLHYHLKRNEKIPCENYPWGRIFLQELDLPRDKLMQQRYSLIFKNNYPSIHHVLLAMKRANVDIFRPVIKENDKYPYTLIRFLLCYPKNFSYLCMTICDMENLRQAIISFFGIEKCNCAETHITLSLKNFENITNSTYLQNLDKIIKQSDYDSVLQLFRDYNIDMKYLK